MRYAVIELTQRGESRNFRVIMYETRKQALDALEAVSDQHWHEYPDHGRAWFLKQVRKDAQFYKSLHARKKWGEFAWIEERLDGAVGLRFTAGDDFLDEFRDLEEEYRTSADDE